MKLFPKSEILGSMWERVMKHPCIYSYAVIFFFRRKVYGPLKVPIFDFLIVFSKLFFSRKLPPNLKFWVQLKEWAVGSSSVLAAISSKILLVLRKLNVVMPLPFHETF